MKELWWYLGKNFKNSEEYLTYKLKQNMPGPKIDVNVEELIR